MNFNNQINHLNPSLDSIAEIFKGHSRKLMTFSTLVVEELVMNIVKYSNATKPVNLSVIESDKGLFLELTDNGIEFNPKEAIAKGLNKYGLNLVNAIASKIVYERMGNRNCLSILLSQEKIEAI